MTETILLRRDQLIREHEEVFEIDEPDEKSLTSLMKASINGHLEVSYNSRLQLNFCCIDSKTTVEIWREPAHQEPAR
jgi:hypothetical protein